MYFFYLTVINSLIVLPISTLINIIHNTFLLHPAFQRVIGEKTLFIGLKIMLIPYLFDKFNIRKA